MTAITSVSSTTNFYQFLKWVCVKRICAYAFILFGSIACSGGGKDSPISQNSAEKSTKYIAYLKPGQEANGILLKFNANTDSKSRARSLRSAGLAASQEFSLVPGLTLAEPTAGLTINQTIENLSTDPQIAYAEPDYLLHVDATLPNDTEFPSQWALDNSNDIDIDAPEAWAISKGNYKVVIAVIDSGVDYTHPEFLGQIWSNPGEIPNNGRDDDNNGFIDDVRGWDFDSKSNDNDPMDEHGHGTHVAGIIGAQGNNDRGVAGLNWDVQIMPIKFMNAGGTGATSAAIKAINYALANGAVISNNSWGGGNFSQALFDVLQVANSKGHLFVAASGNGLQGIGFNTDDKPHYPSSYNLPNIISVAASDPQDRLPIFSNFGAKTVDLVAPGFQILSTLPNNLYDSFDGTSMAAPFVTGVAGLLLAQNDALSVRELKAAILDNVDPVVTLSGLVLTGGRLNAFNALNSISSIDPVDPLTPSPSPVSPVEIMIPTTQTLAIGDELQLKAIGGDGTYTWFSATPTLATIDNAGLITTLAAGSVRITVTDSTGLVSLALLLTINDPASTVLVLKPLDLSEVILDSKTLIAVYGGVLPYSWRSSDPGTGKINVTVDTSRASVSAESIGSFTVTVTDADGFTVSRENISVVAPLLNIGTGPSSMIIGETVQLTATGGTSPYEWASSDLSVATVDAGGSVEALAPGSSTISVTDIMQTSLSLDIQVIEDTLFSLNITPADSILNVGVLTRLKATGGGATFTWTSSDPTIATIDKRGIVNGVTEGVVQITVIDENGDSGNTSIEIRSINIIASKFTIDVGEIIQFTAEGGAEPYVWAVSNTSLAIISDAGLLTSNSDNKIGGILVSATDSDGISKSITVTIIDAGVPPPGAGFNNFRVP